MSIPSIEPSQLLTYISELHRRIEERFPDSGLSSTANTIKGIIQTAKLESNELAKPIYKIRWITHSLIAVIIAAIIVSAYTILSHLKDLTPLELIQIFETAINDIVFVAIAIFFLHSIEKRIRRRKALHILNELNNLAHIIDLQQLSKDPVRMHWQSKGLINAKEELTPMLITRYLDYCSELLSMISKIAAVYAQHLDDEIVLNEVGKIQQLTTSLSNKIWQKLMIFHQNEMTQSK